MSRFEVPTTGWMPPRQPREIRTAWLVLAVLAWPAVVVACLRSPREPLLRIAEATDGLVQPTLLYSLLLFLVVIVGILVWKGGLRPADVGLVAAKVMPGIIVTCALWGAVQIVLIIAALLSDDHGPARSEGSGAPRAGALIAQLLGNAFAEETMFRGFLLTQLFLKFAKCFQGRTWRSLVVAVVLSQCLFALIHIPNLSRLGTPGGDAVGKLAMVMALGVFLSLLYLRTDNLFIVTGVHALINAPTPLVKPTLPAEAIVFVLAVVLLACWPWDERGRAVLWSARGGTQ